MSNVNEHIDVRFQSRNARKAWTLVENLPETFMKQRIDWDKIVKYVSKQGCSCTMKRDINSDRLIMQLQGNQVDMITAFIIGLELVPPENVRKHKGV